MLCSVCGNEVEIGCAVCPFCGTPCPAEGCRSAVLSHRQVNLERGKPLVHQAIGRLEGELAISRALGCKVLTLIHGYGSSGTGGAIKEAGVRPLHFFQYQGRIKAVIPGERFEGRSGRGRQLLRQYPFLAEHRDLNRANPGITLVIL
jgi:hypothetical protein